ncbi:MAG: aspartate--tRNA(Asn) ligase [Candidatus Aenigmarchaeota archaeon]|nr:aspartate--tRNA(Asn) ligase [Candidatus Aenigmarchaeota archaeon]
MERTYTHEVKAGSRCLLKGWVAQIRDLGGLKFFILRDREGFIQVTLKKGAVPQGLIEFVNKLGREDCVSVTGEAKESKQAPNGVEVIPEKMELVSKARSPLPLDFDGKIQSGVDKRFDYRFLDLRNPQVQAIFRIRDKTLTAVRNYFESSGFVEVQTPIIQAAGAEGGATLFPLIYYQKEAFLRQSPQLYKQMMMASGLDRIYEIGSVFRAEKFHTRRHVSEFLSVDAELAWIDSEEDVMRVLDGLICGVYKDIRKACRTELEIIGRKIDVPEAPFKRLAYDDVIKLLGKEDVKIEWGDDLDDPHEKKLGELMAKKGHDWYFITKYPAKIKPFYIMMDGDHSRGIDLDNQGLEIASGGQREHRHDKLVSVMKSKGLDPHKFEFFLNAFLWGMPSHGGFGLGADRLVQQIVGIEHVRETILFPRTPDKLVP